MAYVRFRQRFSTIFLPKCAIKEPLKILDRPLFGSVMKHEVSYEGLDFCQVQAEELLWDSTQFLDKPDSLELALLIVREAWGILVIDFGIPVQASLFMGLYFGPWIYMLTWFIWGLSL